MKSVKDDRKLYEICRRYYCGDINEQQVMYLLISYGCTENEAEQHIEDFYIFFANPFNLFLRVCSVFIFTFIVLCILFGIANL